MKRLFTALFLLTVVASVLAQEVAPDYEESIRLRDERVPEDYLVPGTKFEDDDGHDQYMEEKKLFDEWLESNPLVITKEGFVMPRKEAEAAGIYSGEYEFLDAPPEAEYYHHEILND